MGVPDICFKCLDISAFQTLFYQMHVSGYVCKCLSLQGKEHKNLFHSLSIIAHEKILSNLLSE